MTFHRRLVLIYGDSLILEGISNTLRSHADLVILTSKPPADPDALNELHPDLVLVDAAQVSPSQVETLIAAFPVSNSPPVVRLDTDAQRLMVISTQQFPAISITDLEQALEIILKPKQ